MSLVIIEASSAMRTVCLSLAPLPLKKRIAFVTLRYGVRSPEARWRAFMLCLYSLFFLLHFIEIEELLCGALNEVGERQGRGVRSPRKTEASPWPFETEGTRSAGTAKKDEPNFFLIFIIAIFNLYSRCNRSGNSFLKSLTTKFSRSSFSRYGWNY